MTQLSLFNEDVGGRTSAACVLVQPSRSKPLRSDEGNLISVDFTKKDFLIKKNPIQESSTRMDDVKVNPRRGMKQEVYPVSELSDLRNIAAWMLTHYGEKYLIGFVLGVNMGLRINELLHFKRSDVFFPDGSIRYIDNESVLADKIEIQQSKNGKKRTVYLNRACVDVLEYCFPVREERYSNDWLIPNEHTGEHIKVSQFYKVLKKASLACNVPDNVGTHSMRKSFGYWQHITPGRNDTGATCDVAVVQQLLGHASPSTTLRYIGIKPRDEKYRYHLVNLDLVPSSRERSALIEHK